MCVHVNGASGSLVVLHTLCQCSIVTSIIVWQTGCDQEVHLQLNVLHVNNQNQIVMVLTFCELS